MTSQQKNDSPARSAILVSATLADGTIVESLFDGSRKRTSFALWKENEGKESTSIEIEGTQHTPYSPSNNLLHHGVVRLPSSIGDYTSKSELVTEVREFIARYCDLDPDIESIAAHYVLLTWVYDAFSEMPYLRAQAELGSGKTRFLLTVGALCYKAIFASGASTVSPVFRILDAFRGTLVLDEADFRQSDERGPITKLLNNGHAKGFPVLRSESNKHGEFTPTAYHVFGPKLIASRLAFSDRALESRCITFEISGRRPHSGIPLNLPKSFEQEALLLRNKLLRFRFNERNHVGSPAALEGLSVEARISQVFAPLLTMIDDPKTRARTIEVARESNRVLVAERSMSVEARILNVIKTLVEEGAPLRLTDIADEFASKHGIEYQMAITPRWIGHILRSRFHLVPEKSHGTFRIQPQEVPRLKKLFVRYALAESAQA